MLILLTIMTKHLYSPPCIQVIIEKIKTFTWKKLFYFLHSHISLFSGYGNIAELLIQKGANFNITAVGRTMLMWAATRGKYKSSSQLYSSGSLRVTFTIKVESISQLNYPFNVFFLVFILSMR